MKKEIIEKRKTAEKEIIETETQIITIYKENNKEFSRDTIPKEMPPSKTFKEQIVEILKEHKLI